MSYERHFEANNFVRRLRDRKITKLLLLTGKWAAYQKNFGTLGAENLFFINFDHPLLGLIPRNAISGAIAYYKIQKG